MQKAYNKTPLNNSSLDKMSEEFLNEVILNIILREIPEQHKPHLFALAEEGKTEKLTDFAMKNIPDFENKLSIRIKELLVEK